MIPTIRHRRPLAAVASVLLLIAVVAPAAIAKDPKTTDIQILALNDFHGQLEVVDPVVSSAGRIGSLQGSRPNQTCIPGGTPNCIPAGGVEYLATHVRDLRAENPNGDRLRVGRRPHRRDAAAVGPLPRRADHRGAQPDGPRLQRASATTSSTRASTSCCACRTAGLPPGRRLPPATADGFGRRLPVPRRQRDVRATADRRDDLPALRDQEVRGRRRGRVHRHDPRGHAPHRLAGRHRRPSTSSTRRRRSTRSSPSSRTRASRRSSSCSTRAAASRRPATARAASAPINSCDDATGRDRRRSSRTIDDEIDIVITGHTNWAVNCLIDGKVVTGAAVAGPPRHRHRRPDRPQHRRLRPGLDRREQPDRHPGRRRRRRTSPSSSPKYNVFAGADRRRSIVGNVDGRDGPGA